MPTALPVAAATSPPGAPATSANFAARPTLLVGLGVQKSGSTSMYSTLADAAFAARAPSAAELREYEVRRPDAHPEAATNTP